MTPRLRRKDDRPKPRKLILENWLSPGDGVVLSGAIRDLHKLHPGRFLTDLRCPWPALFENNQYITPIKDNDPEAERIKCEYPLIHQSDQRPVHFLSGFTEFLSDKLKVPIHPTEAKGDIHLSDQEKSWIPQVAGSYWICVAGTKPDYGAKQWSYKRWQEVVDGTPEIRWVQIGERGHNHPELKNVIDLRGKTDLRQLVRIVYHCDGVVGPSTLLIHLAAAVPTKDGRLRPGVCIAGAREPLLWQSYPGIRTLSNVGSLPCCASKSCWKARTIPSGDGSELDKSLCLMPTQVD